MSRPSLSKTCTSCKCVKSLHEFHMRRASLDGFNARCKVCAKQADADKYLLTKDVHDARSKEYQKENRERLNEMARRRYALNPKKRERDPEKVKIWNEAYHSKNPGLRPAFNAKYKASKLRATPKWADLQAIEAIYAGCPKGHEVDHIAPLISDLVCGLHWEQNLQYLTQTENRSKGNRFWPDMP